MITSTEKITSDEVSAVSAQFSDDVLSITLSDGRAISIPLGKVAWLKWLLDASPEQRVKWHVEPGGYAIFWDDLDDGIEVKHMLSTEPLA